MLTKQEPEQQDKEVEDTDMKHTLLQGDCLERMKEMPDNSVDSIVTDPPYGLSFMGKKWDYDVPSVEVWRECLRVLKPGGHLLAFAGTRTQHRMAVRIEDAGFEIRDMIAWIYGSGFPKSLDVSKAIDNAAGAEREVVGEKITGNAKQRTSATGEFADGKHGGTQIVDITAPATPEAQQWEGFGTALKPSLEPLTLARKPLGEKTVAANVLAYGTGAINVDGCRVGTETIEQRHVHRIDGGKGIGAAAVGHKQKQSGTVTTSQGRWPANLIHDGSEEVVGLFPSDKQGSASRFFYVPKASKKDRDEGLDSSRTVKHTTGLCKEENMELAELLQKATCESTVKWGIDESGASITGLCLLDSLSTILTAINKITTSQICSLLMPLHTNESIAGANCEKKRGGSLAANAVNSNQSQLNTMSASQVESALGVSHAVSKMLSSISDGANWIPATNFHATVKPTALMRYLCRLVTPPEGIVLDPFMGSGSTGKAAMLEDFRFIGIERDPEYYKIAEARIKAVEPKLI